MDRAVLFAKSPRPGEVKTRMVPPLTPAQALALHEAMLADQLAFLASLARPGRSVELCLDGAWPAGVPLPRLPAGAPRTLQSEGDLGRRMERALARGHASGAARICVVGSDAPTLPAALVEEAFDRLRHGADAVVTPAPDGGYVLIGTAGPHPELFRQIPWGTGAVLATTRRRAADAGLLLEETPGWADVDRVEDLARLLDEAAADPARAPATAIVAASLRLYFARERVV